MRIARGYKKVKETGDLPVQMQPLECTDKALVDIGFGTAKDIS
jgi:hypothetical protein